ncbi:2Fe-2S iron-sulfur cluster-binding protein [Pseudomaricurvus sp.]|uniref:2Fe-2S iron-sulfur cluster-binding protein n=1 Tax=Pseudomaricurvus sp. TaxID=2004510 RepID=UPI003F6C05D4
MPRIIFVEHNDTSHCVDAEIGKSLMQTALDQGIPGIDADCGGSCACGTCHVIIEESWQGKLPAAEDEEVTMLDMTPEPQPGSRLSCQVLVTEELDGLILRLPEFQM